MDLLITPVVMCGGAGTRLWPVSRESMPKQFVPLIGQRSTFQQADRADFRPALFARPIVITNADFRFIVAEQLRECGIEADIVLEPVRRDSGPAVAVAAALAAERDPQALVLVLAADHILRKPDAFIAACRQAAKAVADGSHRDLRHQARQSGDQLRLHPARPQAQRRRRAGGRRLRREAGCDQPPPPTWPTTTSGTAATSCSAPSVMLGEIERFEPTMAKAAKAAVARTDARSRVPAARRRSRSRGAQEVDRLCGDGAHQARGGVPVDFGWSDVGSWNSVWDILDHDADGNATEGPVVMLDSRNSAGALRRIRYSPRSSASTTSWSSPPDDAVLVRRARQGRERQGAGRTAQGENRREAVEHRRIYRPWGYYQGVDTGTRYQVKRIVVKPGAKLSLQKHFHRAEHWVVVRGTAEVTVDDEIRAIHENESIYVPIGSVHRLANPGKIALELIEVQVGSYLGEDDIVRIEDIYARG